MAVGGGEGLMGMEMDHGDSVRGKEVTSQADTIVSPMNYCIGWNLLAKFFPSDAEWDLVALCQGEFYPDRYVLVIS